MKMLILLSFILMFAAQMSAQPPGIRIHKDTPQEAMAKRQGYFPAGTTFEQGTRYYSEDNRYAMVCQADGNLVVYKFASKRSYKPIWDTKTNGRAVKKCVFQTDGNLVLYDFTNKALWDAFTDELRKFPDRIHPASKPSEWYLVMQNDGNLVIYYGPYPQKSPFWASDSFEKN